MSAVRRRESPEHQAWRNMLQRCHNPLHPDYAAYGGRGIAVCEEWRGKRGYINFLAAVGNRPSPQHSLDRRDNNRGYEPGNCWWADRDSQQNNKRDSVFVEFQGEIRSVAQWARQFKIHRMTLLSRLRQGWPMEKAISTPVAEKSPTGCCRLGHVMEGITPTRGERYCKICAVARARKNRKKRASAT